MKRRQLLRSLLLAPPVVAASKPAKASVDDKLTNLWTYPEKGEIFETTLVGEAAHDIKKGELIYRRQRIK